MVSLPPELEEAIIGRAKFLRRSVANYLESLAVADVSQAAIGRSLRDPHELTPLPESQRTDEASKVVTRIRRDEPGQTTKEKKKIKHA